jgi:hypothetical protein
MPEYAKQLDEIARVLAKPSLSPWLMTTFSVVIGVIAGAIGRALEQPLQDVIRRRRMRRVLYVDMAENLMLLAGHFLDANTPESENWHEFDRFLACRSEQYIAGNQEVYMLLSERPYFDIIFELFKSIPKEQAAAREMTLQLFRMFTQMTGRGGFTQRHFRRAIGRPRHEDLLESIRTILRREDTMNIAE